MDHGDDQRNTSLLSQSYMHGIKRITGNRKTYEDEFKITDEVYETRKKTWSWLFEKFSEISDDVELNIQTLRPDRESSSSHSSEVRIPVRKSHAQLQYWIDTGNPPCQAIEAVASESDETVSISESEATDIDEGQYSPCTSMFVNQKLTKSSEQLATGSSASSVDTATYIRKNKNSGTKNERDNRNADNNKVGRSINAATPKASLSRSMELPKNADVLDKVSSVLRKSLSPDLRGRSSRGNGDAVDIVLDENIRRKIDEDLEKRSKNEENKESEVTLESKESGIGSLAVESIYKERGNEERRPSDSSDNVLPVSNQSVHNRRRKLYTDHDSVFDITSPVVNSVRRLTAARKSFHPALDSPSTSKRKKTAPRPRLLTMWERKSMNHSINKRNRTRSLISKPKVMKILHNSQGGKIKAVNPVKASISRGVRVSNDSLTVGADDAERSKEADALAEESLPKNALATNKSKSSSSLSSGDVSQIINEEMEKSLRTPSAPVCKKNQSSHSPAPNTQRFEKEDCRDDQGSIFQTSAGSSFVSKESRVRSMKLVVKNLCLTDLRSLEDTDSLSTPSPDASSKKNEDSLSNASTILLPQLERRAKSLVLSPKVVLHDFLDLRDCCGDIEKMNNENWLKKKNEKENVKAGDKGIGNGGEKKGENVEPKITNEKKLPRKKKTGSKRNTNILSENFNASIDRSNSSEAKTNRKLNDDCDPSNCSREMESDGNLAGEMKSAVTFTNTNENRWDSIFALESSDEEDYLAKLTNTFKSKSRRNKNGKNGDTEPSTGVVGNETIDDDRASKSTKTRQDCYKIVYSSSGEEEANVGTRPRIVRRKYSKRNKPKNSTDSREDECGRRSEGFQTGNEKSEKQSPGVNKRRLGRNWDKQSKEAPRDYLAARSGVDRKSKSVRKLRGEDVTGDGDRCDTVVSGEKINCDRLAEREINDKENEPSRVTENCTTPVDRGQEKSGKSLGSERRKIFRKIANAVTDSEEEPENYEKGNKSSSKTEDKLMNDAMSALLFVSDDDESDNDIAMIFCSKNNKGDGYRGKDKDGGNESRGIGSKKGSGSPKKRGIKDGRHATSSSSKRRTTNRRCTNSTIVFRTKECWELDSENS